MINIGFVGTGDIAETHAYAIEQLDNARLIAVTDLDSKRAKIFADRFGATALPDLQDLLAYPGMDLVYILTPPHVHAEQIEAVAQAGLPIFCEKPIALSLLEADEAIAAAAQADVPLMIGHSHRFHPLAAKVHDYVHGGELGTLVAVWSHRLRERSIEPGSWISKRKLSGGLALQYAIHDLDWACWLGGTISQVSAQAYNTQPNIEIEDNLWAFLTYTAGGSASIGVSWSSPLEWTERGVVGTQGAVRIVEQRLMQAQFAGGRQQNIDLGDDYDWFDVFLRENRDIVARLQQGRPFSITGEDGRRSLAVSLAVQYAAVTGGTVTLPLKQEPASGS